MSDLTDAERIARGHNAERALDEFLRPEFEHVRARYTQRILELAGDSKLRDAHRAELINLLSAAVRVVNLIEEGIAGAVRDGEHARAKLLSCERVENLSPARRRLAQIGLV